MIYKKNILDIVRISGESVKKFEGERNYLSTGNLNFNKIVDLELVTYDSKPSRANQNVNVGEVIFAKMKDTKKTLVIDESIKDLIVSTGFYVLEPSKQIMPKYLYHYLNSQFFLNQKNRLSKGATQCALNNEGLANIKINMYDIDIQKKIVEILDKSEMLIEKRKEQIEALDELVKSKFIEMFGDPILNPLGWDTKTLLDICESIVDCPHSTPKYTNENTGFMCIRTTIIKKNKLLWDDIEYIAEDEFNQRIKRRKPKMGDIVYSREGAILGIAAIIDRDYDVALGQRLMLLSPENSICKSEFLCVAMNFETFLNKALEKVGGSASPHINVGDIKVFKMIVPPLELQKEFADFVKKVDKLKFELENSLKELEDNFNSLMQRAFKGELF